MDAPIGGTMAHSPDTPFQFILMIHQSATGQVLIDALAPVGLEVEREAEVLGLRQDSSSVRIDAVVPVIRCPSPPTM